MGRVNNYPLQGPLGSIDPKLPVCVADLHSKLNDPSCDLKERWRKVNITAWAKEQNKGCPMYKPSKRAAATSTRVRLPGDTCQMHSQGRVVMLAKLRQIRAELKAPFIELSGKDFGLTVGIFACDAEPMWRDIVLVKYVNATDFKVTLCTR